MNRLLFKCAWPLTVVTTFAPGTFLTRAGDAIIFPSEKPKSEASKTEPSRELPGSREKLKVWDSLPAADPRNIEGLVRPGSRNSRKKTEQEKQLQREHDQKVNWLLLRPDQLREEQEQQEMVPFPDRDAETDEGNGRRDYTFHGLDETKDVREGARQDPRANPRARNANIIRNGTEDSESGEGRRALPGRSGQDLGSHTAKELDLSGIFGPNPGSRAVDVGRSDPIWGDVPGPSSPRSRNQRPDRLGMLGSSLAVDSTPASPTPLDIPSRSSGNSAFGSFPASRGLTPGLPDWAAQRSTAPSQSASAAPRYNPWDQQPVNRPSVIRPTVLEIPQRKL